MEKEKLIEYVNEVSNKIVEIQEKRKRNKENFNFFSAIVSGKHDKEHIEKYHSNVIAYLLNPKASHGFDTLFLKHFLGLPPFLNVGLPNEKDLASLKLERERETTEGGFIDISLEGKDWIIFIENKIWAVEGKDQINGYYNFANEGKFTNKRGIYLTLEGDSPNIGGSIPSNEVISLSYRQDIIQWLKCCRKQKDVKKHHNVVSAIEQYITVIKNILRIMDEETNEIVEYLKKDVARTAKIIKNHETLNKAIRGLMREVRDKFRDDLDNLIQKKKKANKNIPDNLNIDIVPGDYLLSGDSDNSYGLGFEIKNGNIRFQYKGSGFGGCGDRISIDGKNAHWGEIDEAYAILLTNYQTPDWDAMVGKSADDVINEVTKNVLPGFNKGE